MSAVKLYVNMCRTRYVSSICFFVLAIMFSQNAKGQCCSGGVPMSGNLGMPSADKNTVQLAVSHDFNRLTRFQTGRNELTSKEFSRETNSILVEAGYSLSQKWSVDVFLSWVRQKRDNRLAGVQQTTSGIGDATLLLKYRLLSSLNVGAGIKAPLGASDFTFTEGGIRSPLPLDLQPGSGAWDGVFWANYTTTLKFLRPSTTFSTTTTFRLTGKNDEFFSSTYEVGNEFLINTSVSDRFLLGTLIFDPSFGINYRRQGTDISFEFENPNSGGDFVFINPGIAYQATPDLTFQVNSSIPVYQQVGGTQVANSFRINTGVFYRFSIKKN